MDRIKMLWLSASLVTLAPFVYSPHAQPWLRITDRLNKTPAVFGCSPQPRVYFLFHFLFHFSSNSGVGGLLEVWNRWWTLKPLPKKFYIKALIHALKVNLTYSSGVGFKMDTLLFSLYVLEHLMTQRNRMLRKKTFTPKPLNSCDKISHSWLKVCSSFKWWDST